MEFCRYVQNNFSTQYKATIGAEFLSKEILTGDKIVSMQIWDTAGQETFNELHPSYYFGANVGILVFDATRKITYQNLAKWYAEMRVHCPDIPCILVANKIDGTCNIENIA